MDFEVRNKFYVCVIIRVGSYCGNLGIEKLKGFWSEVGVWCIGWGCVGYNVKFFWSVGGYLKWDKNLVNMWFLS